MDNDDDLSLDVFMHEEAAGPAAAAEPTATCGSAGYLRRLDRVLQTVARPLNANLLRRFDDKKFHIVKASSKILSAAVEAIGSSRVAALMALLGFEIQNHAEEGKDDKLQQWVYTHDQAFAVAAEKKLSILEKNIELALRCAAGMTDDTAGILESRTAAALAKKEAERIAALERQRAAIQHDAEQRRKEQNAQALDMELRSKRLRQDFTDVEHLVEKSKLTLHNTGRLRNASFQAKHYQLRRMQHGRSFLCKCPDDYLEAHWHVVSGSLLYAYCVHLNADASVVSHVGYEYAFQYNTIPGTEHFGQTIWTTSKHVNEETGVIDMLHHPNKVVDVCVYCGEPFKMLFL